MTPALDMSTADGAENLEPIRQAVLARFDRQLQKKKRLRAGGIVLSVALIGGAITAGALAVSRAPQTQIANSVACYEQASLSSRRADVGQATDAYDAKTGKRVPQPAPDLLALCQLAWRAGDLGEATPAPDPNKGTYPVPRLALCQGPNGVAAGFPNPGSDSAQHLCNRLGLAPWPGRQ